MKWTTKDCYGNTKTWYSEDVIEKIRKIINVFENDCKGKVCNCLCCSILELLNEVDNENTKNKCINPDQPKQA